MSNEGAIAVTSEQRGCTCPADEAPVPCARRYALHDCKLVEARRLAEQLCTVLRYLVEDDYLFPRSSDTPTVSAVEALGRIMTSAELGAYLHLSNVTLERFRMNGEGPRYIKLGQRKVVYRFDDVQEWLASRERQQTERTSDVDQTDDRSDTALG